MKRKLNVIIKHICIMTIFLFLVLLGTNIKIDKDKVSYEKDKLNVSKWNGALQNVIEISDVSNPNAIDYVYFSDFISNLDEYQNKNVDDFYVVIETANDLQYASMLMNGIPTGLSMPVVIPRSWFLSLNYLLGRSISFSGQRIYPMGNLLEPFVGSFDGQGFSLINLFLATIDATIYENYYQSNDIDLLEYYGLFSYVGVEGKVSNLSLTNPQAVQVDSINNTILYAAPLVGHNAGLIENCRVINDDISSEFTISNDITIATMVGMNANTGIIKNSFVGLPNAIFTSENAGEINEAYPVVYYEDSDSDLENVYYDMEKFIPEMTDFSENIISIEHTADFQNPSLFATEFVNNWFFNVSYSGITLNDTYPILQGLRLYKDSIDTYAISKATDLIVFSKLITSSDKMATNNYILTSCIDMKSVARNSYVASQRVFSGTLSSEEADEACSYNHNNEYHSIWNLTTAYASSGDVTTYALVNQLSGTIENINLINFSSLLSDASTYVNNVIYAGSVAGKVTTSGVINNVNVYGTITLPNGSSNYGKVYIGGIVGNNAGLITNSTFNGQISGGIHQNGGNLLNNNGIGGIAGYTEGGTFTNLKNASNIVGMSFTEEQTTATTYVGGIVGFGNYAKMEKVINKGLIISHDNSNGYINNAYIGGIVSLITSHSSITKQVINQGEIYLMVNNSNQIRDYYGAGFGTISTSSTTAIDVMDVSNSNTVQLASSYTINNQEYVFNTSFSSHTSLLTTSGGTTVNPSGSTNIGGAIKLTGVIIIDKNTSANLTGIYQSSEQTIDLGLIYRYAPVVYSLNESNSYVININYAYNTGDLHFITTKPMYNQKIAITANTYGDYINFNYLRNEGNINVDITYPSINTFKLEGSLTDYSANMRISGLVGTLNDGYHIYNSYNGGNFNIRNWVDSNMTTLLSVQAVTAKTDTLQYMLYIGGIAFKNNNSEDVEDPNNVIISSTKKGAIHNSINDGDMNIDLNLYGCSRIGGIVSINAGLISSCFNTGTLYNYVALYINPGVSYNSDIGGNQFEVEAGGIACMITSNKGQIIDSANYGDVYCISPVSNGAGWLNAGGIVGRNEKLETNRGNAGGNWEGKIEFCVNYGNIYAWNAYTESFGEFLNGNSSTAYIGAESSCKSAGIMAIGVINVINCANYGDIYSRYLAGGIFGLVDGTKFDDIDKNIYIANSINYGKVRPINAFTKEVSAFTKEKDTDVRANFTISETVPTRKAVTISSKTYYINSMYGGIIGYLYAHSSWSRDGLGTTSGSGAQWSEDNVSMITQLLISFLINFDEKTNIIGSQSLYVGSSKLTDTYTKKYSQMTQYLSTVNPSDASMYPFNSTNNFTASYNDVEYEIKSYSLSTESGGIFASDYPLRQGELDNSIITNEYIRNYISFVAYEYTNKNLIDKVFAESERIGVYAVASSKGILNGKYLPDNVLWGDVDEPGLDPITNGVVNTSWRGEVTDNDSLNYKFKKGMKQLEASIANTVYDLELISVGTDNVIIDAPEIDNENKIITFYVGDNEEKEGNGTLISNVLFNFTATTDNPIIDETNKTITYYNNTDIILQYSYASGELVRIDNNDTYIYYSHDDTNTVETNIYQYTPHSSYSGSITNYYVTKDGGLTYQKATSSDTLYTITVTSSSWGSYDLEGNDYIYKGRWSGDYNISNATEATSRNDTTKYYTKTTSSNPNYLYVGTGVPDDYILYTKEETNIFVSYPIALTVYEKVNSNYYDKWYTINTNASTYTLSEGASLKIGDASDSTAANNVRIAIPSIQQNVYTSSINEEGVSQYLYVYSEAGTYSKYEIRIVRLPAKELSDVSVEIDSNIYTSENGSIVLMDGSEEVELDKATTKEMKIDFTTINIPDKQNLLITTALQKEDANGQFNNYLSYNVLGEEIYSIIGGAVVNKSDIFDETTGEYESAPISADGTFPNGSVHFDLSFGSLIAAGDYRFLITIGSNEYIIAFKIAFNTDASVNSFTYNNDYLEDSGEWINENKVNELLSIVRFDAQIEELLENIATNTAMSWDNIVLASNGYLSNLTISPYATLNSIAYNMAMASSYSSKIIALGGKDYSSDTTSRIYTITYNMVAEDGGSKSFIHYIVEEMVDTDIEYVYMDGINQGSITELSFTRTNKPIVKVFYNFDAINYIDVQNFQTTITYNYDESKYPKQGNGDENQAILDSISSIDISSTGMQITFVNDVACEYTINVAYTRHGEDVQTIIYQNIAIRKTYNTESKLTRILFNTETPFTSLGTIIYNGHQISSPGNEDYVPALEVETNQVLLTSDIYNILNENDTLRKIKSMPNLIYYNNEEPMRLEDANDASIIYNRYDVIGFVSKTDLSNFTPSFTLPLGAVIYQLDDNNNPLLDSNGEPVLNASFITDTGDFSYIHYRVYSEASSVDSNGLYIPNEECDNYTDYYIFIVDVSYNVYFDVEFLYADGNQNESNIFNTLTSQNTKSLLSLQRYEEMKDNGSSYPSEDFNIKSNIYYFFTTVNDAKLVTTYSHTMSATASGYFKLYLDLPKGYKYTFTFSGDEEEVHYEEGELFLVPSRVFAYRYTLTVTIAIDSTSDEWGQHGNIDISDLLN